MPCAQGLLRLLWGGARSWSATGLIALGLLKKKTGSLVTMVAALFFGEHSSATNLPITIFSTLLSLNSLTLDYIRLLVSFSVSSIHITWMLENTLFISQFCSSSSSGAVNYNKSIQ